MAARNLGSTGRNSATAQKRARIARLTLAGRQVRGGWTLPVRRTDWFSRTRDVVSWKLASWSLMLGTRWYREMISGAVALGLDTATKQTLDSIDKTEDTIKHDA